MKVPAVLSMINCVCCRVTEVDKKSKRVLLSLKKEILSAKTPPITHPAAATPGTRTHGWITGITDIGVFIGLYSRLKGLVPTRELDLPSGSSAKEVYHVGQVVKCTIVRGDTGKGLILSLAGPAAAAAAAEAAVAADKAALAGLEPGDVVQGARVTSIRCVGELKSQTSLGKAKDGVAEKCADPGSDDGATIQPRCPTIAPFGAA
jgi:predicted RNA-binding protein with RPS1 domain